MEAADRAKDEFLASLSHELRTPLNTVLGWLTMLRTGSMREAQRAHALAVIDRNARLLAQLIEDLLDVSRIVMGKIRLVRQPLAITPIVGTVLESIRPAAEAKGVALQARIAPDAGPICGDSARIQQIVWNLLSNAVKFTPAGGRVSLELTRDEGCIQLCVRDTGVGIPPQFLPHVFERFRQADSSTTRAHGGMGLGLAIVRDLVELHGGSIEARSGGIDRGATFVVRFPVLPASSDTSSRDVDKPALPPLEGVRVLVVDNDAETRDLLSQALAVNGARVTTAESAREAFAQLSTGGADVLVSDIGMPGEDGFSLMRRVRSLPGIPGRIPAIALTAYARASDQAEAMEAGYQMYLAKPVELAALQAGLATLTGRVGS
jgi:CheY-like chemotaxis protein/anti-sigma regulatory factor (Ser/Thr protein kinase)